MLVQALVVEPCVEALQGEGVLFLLAWLEEVQLQSTLVSPGVHKIPIDPNGNLASKAATPGPSSGMR
jgi:hypothetical protein